MRLLCKRLFFRFSRARIIIGRIFGGDLSFWPSGGRRRPLRANAKISLGSSIPGAGLVATSLTALLLRPYLPAAITAKFARRVDDVSYDDRVSRWR